MCSYEKRIKYEYTKALTGFAVVMVAASIWSLIIPSLECYLILFTLIGFWLGILFLLLLDHFDSPYAFGS